MRDRLKNFFNDTLVKWRALDPLQRRRIIMGSAGLFLALAITIFLTFRTSWVILVNNREQATTNEIRMLLAEEGIPYRLFNNARGIEVREQDHYLAINHVHTHASPFVQADLFLLQDALNEIGMATSEDARREMFRRAEESELVLALMAIEGIEDASVTIVHADPRDRFLNIGEASASVALQTSLQFSNQQAEMLANLIAASVEGLTIENVVITDQFLTSIFNGGAVGDDRFGGSNIDEDLRTARMVQIFHGVSQLFNLAWDDVRVFGNIDVNLSEETVTERTVATPDGAVPGSGLITREEILNELAEGAAIDLGEEPGAAANVGGISALMMANLQGDTMATRDAVSREMTYNLTNTVSITPPGAVIPETSNISVIVTRNVLVHQYIFENGDVEALLPEGAVWFEGMTWTAFVQTNQEPVELDIAPGWITTVANSTGIPEENISVMGVGHFIFIEAPQVPINWYTIILGGVLAALVAMLFYGLVRGTKQEEVVEVEPELSVEDLLVSTRIEEAQTEEEAQSLQEIAYAIDSEVKQQIDKFVNEKPEAVAQLLRSWMNEGWE
ncbi:MAG: hypothetical protein FWG63_11860 [Defluviitaleaceae bacterium]|nr:hypothetical protein [Defluviitaleaceae bacterium]